MPRAPHAVRDNRTDRRWPARGGALLAFVALVAAALGTTAPWAATPASAAPGDPFDAADPLVFVGQGQPTGLYQAITNADGEVEFQTEGPTSPVTYNALAYNTGDNYLYAMVNSDDSQEFPEGSLIRIGQEGALTRVGTETYSTSIIGAFGDDGLYYSAVSGNEELQVIDVSTGNLVDTIELDQPMYGDLGGPDFALLDGYFWGAGSGAITRTDPATGEVTYFPDVFSADLAIAGAAWTFGNGNLGFSFNATGTVMQLEVENPDADAPTFTVVSTGPGPSSTNNDGAASPGQPTDLSVDKTGPAALVPGGTIEYTITVTNHGPGNSSGFTVSDTIPDMLLNPDTDEPNCTVAEGTFTCIGGRTEADTSVDFTISAEVPDDLDPQTLVENTATVSANEEDPDEENNTSTSGGAVPEVQLEKEVASIEDANGNGLTDAGDLVHYNFTVTNTGLVDLSDIAIEDPLLSEPATCPVTELTAGDETVCTATYTLTQDDVDASWVANTATASGVPTGAEEPITSEPSTTGVEIPAVPALTITKTADPATVDSYVVDQEITYTFLVTNTGNVTQTWVEVVEGEFTGSGELGPLTCPDGAGESLAPGDSFECTALYTLTQEDIEAGSVENSATATGFPPGGEIPIESPPSTVTIPPPAEPALSVVKTSDTASVQEAGHVITYEFLVTNTGNVTIEDVTIDEGEFTGAGELEPVTCPAAAAALAPDEEVVCTTTYEVVEADLTGGELSNTATAIGSTPGGDPVTSPESTTTTDTVAPLPTTGSSVLPIAALALLLVGAGTAFAVIRRRSAN
ncbi:DUF7507 domain-containing protein [Ruania rhizosphaerae]|uniref:DUF7507 domain-containing protein n=1 Tax=Ruania rhizosphaerae TaxID=1840413 RepID=UPI0013571F78|nr:DUF11 domain-containing protein [Ruania rhizosphaerae]